MGKKVLIVEPDAEYAEPTKELLIRQGYSVLTVDSGKKALVVCKRDAVDFVISEFVLPDMEGLSLCRDIKASYDVPFMFISSEADPNKITEGFRVGCDDYMTKPFHFGEMCIRMKTRMGMYERLKALKSPETRQVSVGDLFIDKVSRRVEVAGEEKTFTAKEYDMLLFLAEHPNQVFSKEDLFRAIWEMESVGDIATVTVHIKKIRSKIEKDSANPKYIETIWGAGYRFKA
ncbi:MAG: response regulator transcription factor [Lachnospiraceae bacterium]|nr:response regulator transcription factor [Lachnospiraceae bacterium]